MRRKGEQGGFETEGAWRFALTATQAGYITAQAHTGTRAARLGLLPVGAAAQPAPRTGGASVPAQTALAPAQPERNLLGESAPAGASYSTAYQTISVPASAAATALTFWYRPGTQATAGDFQRALLLRPTDYSAIVTVMRVLEGGDTWRQATFDLIPYRGQSLVLYFEVYNDDISAGPRAWMFLDDVSVQACTGQTPSPTTTWTPTLAWTPTATPTQTAVSVVGAPRAWLPLIACGP